MVADCSSTDFKAKFVDATIRTPRIELFFKIIMPSRISFICRKSCVACSMLLNVKFKYLGYEKMKKDLHILSPSFIWS